MLLGNGKQYRYIKVTNRKEFPKAYIMKLLMDAYAYSRSISKAKDCPLKGTTITRSAQAVKRWPGGIRREPAR